MRHKLGAGILGWARSEERSECCGLIILFTDAEAINAVIVPLCTSRALVGRKGSLIAIVGKVERYYKRSYEGAPTAPDVGQEINLGRGILFIDDRAIGLRPYNRPWDLPWLSRHNLARAHNCTVELYFAHH